MTTMEALLQSITPARRQADARALVELCRDVTGAEPVVADRQMITFGKRSYRYPTGRTGETAVIGIAPRKAAISPHLGWRLDGIAPQLARLGPHRTGVGCLYIADLANVDQAVLREILLIKWNAGKGDPSVPPA